MQRSISPILLMFALVAACSSPDASPDATPATAAANAPTSTSPTPQAAAKVTPVDDPSLVCMINNQFMDSPQIPVEVEGTTYYGCCEMCKVKLAEDPESRFAIDPVSGAKVDKAHAVLGKTQRGAILYFESAENLAKYAQAD